MESPLRTHALNILTGYRPRIGVRGDGAGMTRMSIAGLFRDSLIRRRKYEYVGGFERALLRAAHSIDYFEETRRLRAEQRELFIGKAQTGSLCCLSAKIDYLRVHRAYR